MVKLDVVAFEIAEIVEGLADYTEVNVLLLGAGSVPKDFELGGFWAVFQLVAPTPPPPATPLRSPSPAMNARRRIRIPPDQARVG